MQKSAKNPAQQRLLRIIDQFPRVSVAVIADLVADEFVFGEIVRVSRDGKTSRFLPVKDNDELARRRPEIEIVARNRGMIP